MEVSIHGITQITFSYSFRHLRPIKAHLRTGQLRCSLSHLHKTSFLHVPSTLLSYNLLGKRKDFFVSLLINYVCVYEKSKKKVKVVLVRAARI